MKYIPQRLSVGIGSLSEYNLILLTGLKITLKPKREFFFSKQTKNSKN